MSAGRIRRGIEGSTEIRAFWHQQIRISTGKYRRTGTTENAISGGTTNQPNHSHEEEEAGFMAEKNKNEKKQKRTTLADCDGNGIPGGERDQERTPVRNLSTRRRSGDGDRIQKKRGEGEGEMSLVERTNRRRRRRKKYREGDE